MFKMAKEKLKTPDWILEGKEKPKQKKKEKTFKVRKCPECGSTEVAVVLGSEGERAGEWECKACKWKGRNISEKELNEEQFLEHLDKMGKNDNFKRK